MTENVDILLVDDEPRNLDALEAVLARDGYRILRAQDADRALKLLLENDIAAIVLDIKMPNVDGIALAQIIKGTKRFREIPLLFLTAHMVEESDIMMGYGVGAVDYLTKPFNPQILRQKVGVFADLFRKTRALAELNATLEERVRERTAELEESEKQLRAAAGQKDEFLAVLAHELRNPLAPLRTGLHLIMHTDRSSDATTKRTLAAMDRQINHIVRLIDDLLDVSRISRGVLELKKEPTNLATLIASAEEMFHSLLQQREITLVVEPAPEVWAYVDGTRISQIIGNLLHNSSKFTPRGGKVTIRLEANDSEARIHISDNGVGILPEQIDHVFDMFAQGTRTRTSPGVGIGLALAQKLAQLHDGELRATSRGEGRGATFSLTIPGVSADALPIAPPNNNHVESGPPRRILLIEDNEDVADTLASWLEAMGHHVTVARTGTQGLNLALTSKPEVVLCDLGLPEMDGIEVCTQVRARAQHQPTMVALTGWGKGDDREQTRNAGFDHHLVKPVALDVLSELLTQIR